MAKHVCWSGGWGQAHFLPCLSSVPPATPCRSLPPWHGPLSVTSANAQTQTPSFLTCRHSLSPSPCLSALGWFLCVVGPALRLSSLCPSAWVSPIGALSWCSLSTSSSRAMNICGLYYQCFNFYQCGVWWTMIHGFSLSVQSNVSCRQLRVSVFPFHFAHSNYYLVQVIGKQEAKGWAYLLRLRAPPCTRWGSVLRVNDTRTGTTQAWLPGLRIPLLHCHQPLVYARKVLAALCWEGCSTDFTGEQREEETNAVEGLKVTSCQKSSQK